MAFVIQLSFIIGRRKQIASFGPAALHPRPPNPTPFLRITPSPLLFRLLGTLGHVGRPRGC